QGELWGRRGLESPQGAAETALQYSEQWGFKTIKTKAGRDVDEDLRIATALREAVGKQAQLRPDANEGYSPVQAERVLRGMSEIGGIEYFEDPGSSQRLEVLLSLRLEIGLPIAGNMGITAPASAIGVLQGYAADSL